MPAIFITIFAWIIGIAISLYLGTSFGDSDYLTAILAVIICSGVAFVCWLHKFTLLISLCLIFFGFQFYTFGFNISPDNIVSAMGIAFVCLYIWQPEKIELCDSLKTTSFKALKFGVLLWFSYISIHAIYHLLQAYFGHEPGIKNIIKSYFIYIVPYFLLTFFLFQPHRLQVSKHILLWIVMICFFALLINGALRTYQQMYGIRVQMNEDSMPEPFYIPYINLVEGIYNLRGLGPLSSLLGMIILTSRAWNRGKLFIYTIGFLLVPLGIFGSIISGGRATVIICFIYIFITIVLRKKYILLLSTIITGVIFIISINAYSDAINSKLPFSVSRSVQLFTFKKKQEALGSIEDSSKWRNELHMMAIKEWIKNPKNIIFGRGFMGMQEGEDWYTAYTAEDQSKYLQEVGLRRVATHALITDLLLGFGLLGFVLYYFFIFSMFSFCWKTYKTFQISETARDISLILIVCAFSYIVVDSFSAGALGFSLIWLLITLFTTLQMHPFDPTLPDVKKDIENDLTLQEKLKKASLKRQSSL